MKKETSEELAIIILAAGKGTRMKSDLPKVLVDVDNKPALSHVIETASMLSPKQIVIVVGHGKDLVQESVKRRHPSIPVSFAVQKELRGTGNAVAAALPFLTDFVGDILILYGDTPLLTVATLQNLIEVQRETKSTLTLLTVHTDKPAQYGRIIRDSARNILKIREFKDCSPQERLISEINSGVYIVDSAFLPGALSALESNNAQNELYLTDIVARCAEEGQKLSYQEQYDLSEVQGINTRVDKLSVEQIIRRRRLEDLINSGIDILDPSSVCIDSSVRIAPGVIIGPHCVISGDTTIEQNVVIDGFSVLHSCTIGDGSTIRAFVHIDGAKVGAHSQIGPYARLREGTVLEGENRIGNFVETKKAVLKRGVKAPHLSYLGDCSIGEASNIGAGTITCNYDGFKKSQTTIGERVFIGSNSALVAPVTIGNDVTIGAGSVITRSVEAESLALTRPEQKEIVGWTARFRKKVRG